VNVGRFILHLKKFFLVKIVGNSGSATAVALQEQCGRVSLQDDLRVQQQDRNARKVFFFAIMNPRTTCLEHFSATVTSFLLLERCFFATLRCSTFKDDFSTRKGEIPA
jgi:hypothetical protein